MSHHQITITIHQITIIIITIITITITIHTIIKRETRVHQRNPITTTKSRRRRYYKIFFNKVEMDKMGQMVVVIFIHYNQDIANWPIQPQQHLLYLLRQLIQEFLMLIPIIHQMMNSNNSNNNSSIINMHISMVHKGHHVSHNKSNYLKSSFIRLISMLTQL